ncbi:Hpt domain-containing protein, partial [Delftia acidovorans]|uniref:Hpt domain-containing protein n=1 Tax=Delftia acidovorans TaxID=80866 RepID=UPI00387EB029
RQASDHQTMGSVVGELRATLAEAERHLDQYFRNPADATVLAPVSGQMAQMRGVLSVLGLDQATQAMQRMRETVERLVLGEIDDAERPQVFEKLGNSLGAMGFLIDMLSYQRSMARKLFVYDEAEGGLRILMGRRGHRADDAGKAPEQLPALDTAAVPPQREAVAVAQPLPVPQDAIAEPQFAAPSTPPPPPPPPPAPVDIATEPLAQPAAAEQDALADAAELAQFAKALEAPAEPVFQLDQSLAEPEPAAESAPETVSASVSEPVPVPPPAGLSVSEEDSDDELLGIFLEEAREVVDNGLQALRALADEPGNLSEQTTLRRAFHTLKGSSRMVGLDEFGEAGWAMEQMLNAWLAEQKSMPQPMQELASDALRAFGAWASAIERHQADAWQATPFRAAADAMRLEGLRADVALVPRTPRAEPLAQPEPELEPAPAPAAIEEFAPVAQEPQAEHLDAPEQATPAQPVQPSGELDFALDFDLLEPDPQPSAAAPQESLETLTPQAAEAPAELATDAVEELDFAAFEAAMRDSEQEALAVVAGDPPALPEAAAIEAEAIEAEAIEAEAGTETEAPQAAVPLAPFEGLDLDLGLTPAAAPAEAIEMIAVPETVEAVEAVEAPETVEAVEASDAVELVKAPEVPEAETPQAEESGDEDLSGIDADGFKIVDGLRKYWSRCRSASASVARSSPTTEPMVWWSLAWRYSSSIQGSSGRAGAPCRDSSRRWTRLADCSASSSSPMSMVAKAACR